MPRLGGQITWLQNVTIVKGVIPIRPDDSLKVLVVFLRMLKEMDRRLERRSLASVRRTPPKRLMNGLAMTTNRECIPSIESANVSYFYTFDCPWMR